MKSLSKKLVLMLLLFFSLILLGVLFVEVCVAPITIPVQPMVAPEIVSVDIVDDISVWSPPYYYIDQFSGEQMYAPEFLNLQGAIEITIKNRPFTTYIDKNNNVVNVYYAVFVKTVLSNNVWGAAPNQVIYQSDSDFTVISFGYGSGGITHHNFIRVDKDMVVDFRVQSVVGFFTPSKEITGPGLHYQYIDPVCEGEGSVFTEFSVKMPSIENLDISNNTLTPNLCPSVITPSTSNIYNPSSQNHWASNFTILVVTVCIIIIPVPIILYHNRYQQRKTKTHKHQPKQDKTTT